MHAFDPGKKWCHQIKPQGFQQEHLQYLDESMSVAWSVGVNLVPSVLTRRDAGSSSVRNRSVFAVTAFDK